MRHEGCVVVYFPCDSSSPLDVKRKRAKGGLGDMRQPTLGSLIDDGAPVPKAETPVTDLAFRCGDRSMLRVGNKRLDQYLKESGQGLYVRAAETMDRVDVSELMHRYSTLGRHAIHPRIVLGLIVFGILMGKSSLRELEQLALCDVRAWWI